MTVLVGIRCADGVVIGADGSATFTHGRQQTIEQPTKKKIRIIGERVIVASSGSIGLSQRFCHVVDGLWRGGAFKNKGPIDIGKMLSINAINEFRETALGQADLSVLVACAANGSHPPSKIPLLCELPSSTSFQPEMKCQDDIWYVSVGSGQPIVDPFLAFLRSVFWKNTTPNLHGGIFIALWALLHACEVNPGGINEPITISVLVRKQDGFIARLLSENELDQHRNIVKGAIDHMASFRDILLGYTAAGDVPAESRTTSAEVQGS